MSNAREEGFLFEMPDAEVEARPLSDAYGTESQFRETVVKRLFIIEQLIERLLKQAENRR